MGNVLERRVNSSILEREWERGGEGGGGRAVSDPRSSLDETVERFGIITS